MTLHNFPHEFSFQADIKNAHKIAEELQKISVRMDEIERLSSYIRQKLNDVGRSRPLLTIWFLEPESEDEMKFIEEQMKLTQEKDGLVRKQDYFNVIADLNETTEKIAMVQQKLTNFAIHDGNWG